MCELSVVILGYQAESFIKDFVIQVMNELKLANIHSYEIVIVANYDNDEDNTPEIAYELSNENQNINVLSIKKEGKMGWDMRRGLDASIGEYICVIDGDGQMPASDIVSVYNIIKYSKFDIVKTYRSSRYDGIYRMILSNIYNIVFNMLYLPPVKFKDVNSKPKIITRSAYEKMSLKSNDWFTDAEIMIQSIELKLSICEIATVFYKNERRKSYVKLETVFEFIYNLLYYRFKG